jgi:regulator of replication initiation timing
MSLDTTLLENIAFSNQASPSETISISLADLRQIITDALQPLQDHLSEMEDKIGRLEEDNTALRLKLASLEKNQDKQSENQLIQLQLIHKLKEEIKPAAPPAPSKKTTGHIDELHRLMTEEKSQQVSIAKGARLLGISKERLRQLKPLILQDGRFEMGWSTIKGKKAAVIRIRRFL